MLWLIILMVLAAALYYYLREEMKHFEKLGIPHRKPVIIFGNMAAAFFRRKHFSDLVYEYYEEFKGERYFGFYYFRTPQIIIRDPELIKIIGIKNFDSFMNRNDFVIEENDKIQAASLNQLNGDKWRETRSILGPAFTGSKMKGMFDLVNETVKDFHDFLVANSNMDKDVDIVDLLARCATDVIGEALLGVRINSLKNRSNLYVMIKESVNLDGYKTLALFLSRMFPSVMKYLEIRIFPSEKADRLVRDMVKTTVETREKEGIVRPDLIHLMMQASKSSKSAISTIDDMTAHAYDFLSVSRNDISETTCFATHELAHNPSIQKKLIREIRENYENLKNKENWYETVKGLSYLEAVVRETLRLYPAMPNGDRICTKTFKLPPAHPGASEVTVRPGDLISLPYHTIQLDPDYYPEPRKFMPERFLGDDGTISKEMVNAPHYLPFGVGPRICLGMGFALITMKLMLFHLLYKCELIPSKKTEYPVKLSKAAFSLSADNGFWLRLKTHECENLL